MSQPAKPLQPEHDAIFAAFDRALAEAPRHVETEEERAAVEASKAEVRAGARMISQTEVTADIERWRTGPWPPVE